MSNITLNIVEPGSPVVPNTSGTVAPDTGLFTGGIGSSEATIITISVVALLLLLALVVFTILHKKKTGKRLMSSNKRITTTIILLAILASTGTFIALAKNAVNAVDTDNQLEDENNSSLTVDVSDEELTIELSDEPVFAVLPVEVTVEEATVAGYTLTAYTDNTNLVSTTDSSKVIPMVTIAEADIEAAEEEAAEEGKLTTLTANTYGLALGNEPTSKDDKVYTSLSTDIDNPTILKTIDDYTETPAEDTTTIYYAFYITPDIPYGTYTTNSAVVYEAIPNLATITYDAYGLYYNNDESFTTNIVGYKPSTTESPIAEITGEYLTPAPLNSSSSSSSSSSNSDPSSSSSSYSSSSSSSSIHYTFLGWSKTEGAATPDYEDEEDIIAHLTLAPHESLTLHAVWHYDTVLSFDGNTNDGGTAIPERTIPADTTITLPSNTYTKTHAVFTHWNTVKNPTPDNPGRVYEDGAPFTTPADSSDITLYAQWAYTTNITFDGNGADSGSMNTQTIVAGNPQNLTPNAFTKNNATFIGWNTVKNPTPDNPGTSYTNEQEYVADPDHPADITLHAQWAYTTIDFDINTSTGGSGTMNPITIAGGETTNLPQNTFTKSHCNFTSWNTNADGTGTRYPGEAGYEADNTGIHHITLYAQWQCESIINFYGNGATSGEMGGIMATGGQTTTLPANKYTKTGYSFNGWNTEQNPTPGNPGTPYADQGTYTAPVSESVTLELYAQWLPTTTITFDDNGGSGTMAPQTIVAGTPQNLTPNAFTKEGYVFASWNTEKNPTPDNPGTAYTNGQEYIADTSEPKNITFYAQWKVPVYLYNNVKSLVKKSGGTELTQTAADLKAVITKPTSSDPSVDTSNSGVYKYDADEFGTASDASNDYAIYYYRGILDSNLDGTDSTYGSNGDGAYYPNYVKLGDTCWRIVRTTGSGGVKMIYNGLYSSGTTANSCANAQANAQVTNKAFNGNSTTYQQAVRVGYTYNSTYATNTAQTASIANVFGSDTSPAVNDTNSTMKTYIENKWFNSAIGSYESKLEPSAGYCNDRTVYNNTSPYTQQTEDTSIVTYGTSGLNQLNFGSYVRNKIANGTRTLTLSCARSTVDLYTTSAATNGNKQLSHPVALLTADEAALAGSGGDGRTSEATQSSNYSYSSYVRSGDYFWLLSPYRRASGGGAFEFTLYSLGNLNNYYVNNTYGVRPSISLNHETTVKSGTGTATDPWLINE